ncbi:helix-turn-helix domain-containing protein [Gordonia alkanivorans]|uniref:helix-turn-helix transcriptional regulator n=1 Tax=Gordonia TaxID=2053 RepID=UPI001E41386F|nr:MULTISPECIES: helix-turn-helix domain-containing protein [Gordonia]MDH3025302.1 helix-turn-helix domain-containing protein [Gordonia alkanivorans]
MSSKRYISLAQLSEELDISPRTARRLVAEGKLKAVRLSERCIRVERAELDRFLATASGGIGPAAP